MVCCNRALGLAGNPVDMEQRDGRVDRYAGLSTRRVLGKMSVPDWDDVGGGCSPWGGSGRPGSNEYIKTTPSVLPLGGS